MGNGWYHIARFGPFVGVNKVDGYDFLRFGIYIMLLWFLVIAFVSMFLPTVLSFLYLLHILFYDNAINNIKERNQLGLITIISVVYHLIDFHFGLIGNELGVKIFTISGNLKIVTFNINLMLIHILFIFFSGKITNNLKYGLFRGLYYLTIMYFSLTTLRPTYEVLAVNIIGQHKVEEDKPMVEEDEIDDGYIRDSENEDEPYVNDLEYDENGNYIGY